MGQVGMTMTPEQFCYWLQGRAEMQPDTPPSGAEWKMIRERLATVFAKVTPPLTGWAPARPTTSGNPPLQPLRVECLSPSVAQTYC